MNKFITFCLVFFSQIVFSQTITNQGMNFSPDTITINLGDTVNFVLGNSHNAVEVSQSTFLSNGSTLLSNNWVLDSTSAGGQPESLTKWVKRCCTASTNLR